MLNELGSNDSEVELPDAALCCSNCSKGEIPHSQISDVLKRNKQTRTKKRQPLREINHSLKHELERRLKDERCKIKGEIEGFHFLGDEVDRVQRGSKINSWSMERFYNVVVDVTSNAPHQVNMDIVSKGNDIHYYII